jgi:hypothetical protein
VAQVPYFAAADTAVRIKDGLMSAGLCPQLLRQQRRTDTAHGNCRIIIAARGI